MNKIILLLGLCLLTGTVTAFWGELQIKPKLTFICDNPTEKEDFFKYKPLEKKALTFLKIYCERGRA